MAASRERIAVIIKNEIEKNGMGPLDLAVKISVNPRTVERWIEGKTTPQIQHANALSKWSGRPVTDFRPDLQAEEDAILERLGRVEADLRLLVNYFEVEAADDGTPTTRFAAAFPTRRVSPAKPSGTAAAKKK